MGSDRFYPEEAPCARVSVPSFHIDATPVTNADFAAFVADTGYVTLAEIAPDPADYPGMPMELAHPGSLVFEAPQGPIDFADPAAWWRFVIGADWRHPSGPDSSLDGLEDHPVVHVAYHDAAAYAQWAQKALPTEAEWEFAAKGGVDNCDYAWGPELAPDGVMMANYWQGRFPEKNLLLDGWQGTSPVGSFPANLFGLQDMIGNVWEWTADNWSLRGGQKVGEQVPCCTSTPTERPVDRDGSEGPIIVSLTERKVLKGGSHLCAENYCRRYRPAARIPQAIDSGTSHVGFRCVLRGL